MFGEENEVFSFVKKIIPSTHAEVRLIFKNFDKMKMDYGHESSAGRIACCASFL